MIGAATTFESTWHVKLQMELKFPFCCNGEVVQLYSHAYQMGWEPNETITTQYGDGEIYAARIKDGMIYVELAFQNDCSDGGDPTEWSDASEL